MGRQRESRTGIAVLAFIVASAAAQFNSNSVSILPNASIPYLPSHSPSTPYEEKTDAPLPQVSNDGTVCTGTGRRAMGKCSSGFVQCIGGKLIARRCPGQTLFDEMIGLCVYDLDECEMDVDVVDVTDQETTVPVTTTPQQDKPAVYDTQPVQSDSSSSYTQDQSTQSPSYEQYSQSPQSTTQQQYNQNGGYESQFSAQYQTGYQSSPRQYQNGEYESVHQNGDYVLVSGNPFEGDRDRRRDNGRRRSHKNLRHSGDYVIVSGNPFGGEGNRVLNDEWNGRKEKKNGFIRSSLTDARGHRIRNVIDQFEGHVSHSAPPLGEVNPFAVKRADGHRRRGRKNCRRDKNRRRGDCDECDEDIEEKVRPTARKIDVDDRNEWRMNMEENGDTESTADSSDEQEKPVESEAKEEEKIADNEGEADPELMPESIDNGEIEETNDRVNEVEKKEDNEETEETTTEKEALEEIDDKIEERNDDNDDDEDEEESEDGSINREDTSITEENVEEKAEEQTEETENGVEEVNEDDIDKESDENAEAESNDESKRENMELPESIEEKEEDVKDDEKIDDKVETNEENENETEDISENDENQVNEEEIPESIEEPAEMIEEEEKETEETSDSTVKEDEIADEETKEVKDDEEETTNETESVEDEEKEIEREDENVETGETIEVPVEETDENNEEKEKEETPMEQSEDGEKAEDNEEIEEMEEIEDTDDNQETSTNEERKEEKEERPEFIEEPTNGIEDGVKEETESTTPQKPIEEVSDKIDERSEDNEDDEEEEESEDGSINREDTSNTEENVEEKAEDQKEEIENNGGMNEDDNDKELEEDGETESNDESKREDVELPESMEEKEEDVESPESVDKGDTGIKMEFEENGEKKGESTSEKTAEGEFEMDPASVGDEKVEEAVEKKENDNGDVKDEEKTGDEEESNEGNEKETEDISENDEENEESPEEQAESNDKEDTEETQEEDEEGEGEEQDEERSESIEKEEENGKNRRRRRSVAYDPSISNESPSRRLSIPRSSRLHRSRFSRLCSSSTTGQTISIGQCRQDFVYCKSARRPVVAACPVGDLFDAVMSTCVPTEICGADLAKIELLSETPVSRPTSVPIRDSENPTMPSPTESTTTQKTIDDVVIDEKKNCSTLSDGAYPLSDCSPRYFVCAASIKYSYKCPAGLVYDKPTDGCQWPNEVISCGGGVTADVTSTSTSTENSYSGDSIDRDIIATTAPTTVSTMHATFKCNKDGGFTLDCTGGFVMCSNGVASMMRCPPALVFDDITQSCQYPAHVGSCGLAPTSSSSSLDIPSTTSTLPPYIQFTPTTSSPARAIEILVNTPVDKDACSGVSSGVDGVKEVCPSTFYICNEGRVTATMNCADGTFFDTKMKRCDYREIACDGGWNGEAHGVEEPVKEDIPTVSIEEYGRRASRPYRPLVPVDVEKIEKKEEVKREEERPVVIPSSIESAEGAKCDWKGAAPSGDCSSQFITCSNGRPQVFDCTAGLVFASSLSACEYPQFVPGCPQYDESSHPSPSSYPSTSSSSTSSPVSDAVVVEESISEYTHDELHSTTSMRPLLPIQTGEHTSAKFEATGESCIFSPKQPAFPLNYCSMTYAVCTANGLAYRTNCTFGYLFDSVIRQCVPSEHCGQPYMKEIGGASPPAFSPIHSMNHLTHDSRCVGVKDGTLKATSLCSGKYIRCEKESVMIVTCSSMAHIFSPLTGRCVLRVQMAECNSSPKGGLTPAITLPKTPSPSISIDITPSPSSDAISSSSYPTPSHRGSRIRGGLSFATSSTPFDASSFCTTKHSDGLYRHPENCAGIVQCFGGEAFSYPSCAPGLFFNEVDSQCDYASNVPECASQSDPIALDDSFGSCKGQPHGSHLADDSNCSTYYRCVWGTMEKLSCPDGTVFNPRLSVCDYPSEVPHCQKQ